MKVTLKIRYNKVFTEHELTLNAKAVVGRSRQSQIKLEDNKASASHCQLTLRGHSLELIDLDSKNGTYLNGILIEQTEVFTGDEIRIGDTLITIDESKMTTRDVERLSFLGSARERMDYVLKADFTGARIQNQKNKHPENDPSQMASHAQEIALRKKIKSKIKISKQEIRKRRKITSFTASAIDLLGVFVAAIVPLFFISFLPQVKTLFALSIITLISFSFYNFKIAKFTLGEKITGIKKQYLEQ